MMRHYIILIALSFIVTSCSKDNKKYCWECIMKMKQIYPVEKPPKVSIFEPLCDRTEYDIKVYTQYHTKIDTIKTYVNGVEHPELTTIYYKELTCSKK